MKTIHSKQERDLFQSLSANWSVSISTVYITMQTNPKTRTTPLRLKELALQKQNPSSS